MVRWQVKCLLDNAKALLPAQDALRRLKRRFLGWSPDPPARVHWTIEQGLRQVVRVGQAIVLGDSAVLEIGSNWQPLIPLLYSAAGTRQVYMTDLHRLCDAESFSVAIGNILNHWTQVSERLGDGATLERTRAEFETARRLSFDQAQARLRVKYLAPIDLRRTTLEPGSVQAVVSRAVLEHIPRQVIADIFAEAARYLSPGGVMYHMVDNSDHWEHLDKSLLRINFLRYSEREFAWTCRNPQNYQNRMRHPEYRRILDGAGFQVEREERALDDRSLRALDTFPLHESFRRFPPEDLAAITSEFLARKPSASVSG